MKSKLKFGLDANNKAIIEGYVEHSDDLRDLVAKQFTENFKTTGNLAFFTFCFDEKNQFTVTPFGGNIEDSKRLVDLLSDMQMHNIFNAIKSNDRFLHPVPSTTNN